jgi:type IV secretion system protein VirB5
VGTPQSAFLSARKEWDDRYGSLARGKRNWQLTASALMLLLLVATSGLVWLSTRNRVTPYVVEVDRHGQAVALGPAKPLEQADERFLRFILSLYIHDLRSLLTDGEAQKELIDRAYNHTAGVASDFLNRHFQDHNPFERAAKERVAVQVQSILPLSDESWQVQWTETATRLDARPTATTKWQAVLTVELHPPTNTETLLNNPLGLFVTEIHWTRILGDDSP